MPRARKEQGVRIRKRVQTPFPTNYLPTIPLKISAILRYKQFKAERKRAERSQRKEREIEVSKYSVLLNYLEKEIESTRQDYIKSNKQVPNLLLFKVNPKFDCVLGKVVKYLSIRDEVKVIPMNKNYERISEQPLPRLLLVKVGGR